MREAQRIGDDAAYERGFEEIVREYAGRLYSFANSYVRDPAAAEDVVQESWILFHRSFSTFDSSSDLTPWLFSIVHNKAVDRLKKRKSVALSDEVEARAKRRSVHERLPAVVLRRFRRFAAKIDAIVTPLRLEERRQLRGLRLRSISPAGRKRLEQARKRLANVLRLHGRGGRNEFTQNLATFLNAAVDLGLMTEALQSRKRS